jgi:hypothetical protein
MHARPVHFQHDPRAMAVRVRPDPLLERLERVNVLGADGATPFSPTWTESSSPLSASPRTQT